jgi:hypothetical protein
MTLDHDIVCAEQDIIVKELELKILNGINNINTTILQMQKDINQYEDLGFEVNDLKSFTNNYPFQISFDEFSKLNCWGSDGDEEFLNKEPLPQNTVEKHLNKIGFNEVHTGGGCTGYEKIYPNYRVLLTDGNAEKPVKLTQKVCITIDDNDGNLKYCNHDDTEKHNTHLYNIIVNQIDKRLIDDLIITMEVK